MARPKSLAVATRDGEMYSRWNNGERNLAALAKDYGISPQRVGQVIASKDAQVYAAWRTGKYTLADLADTFELSSEDVTRIVTARHPEQKDEETGRAVLRSRLELLMIAVQEVIENPGYKLAPNGRLACADDGTPLVDVGVRVEALKLQLSAYERASRLDGGDKPQRTHTTVEVAQQEASTFLAAVAERRAADQRELDELRRRAGVIPGQVLPPAIEA